MSVLGRKRTSRKCKPCSARPQPGRGGKGATLQRPGWAGNHIGFYPFRRRTSMNDARRKQIQRALTLIGEAKAILEVALTQEQDDYDNMPEEPRNNDEGERAEEAIDALERAAMGCGDAITACKEAMQG